MTSPRVYIAIPVLLAAAGAGYWYYNARAIQAGGSLSQVPLNSAVTVPPAFVMAVDDSGSMTFQTLFPGQDGQAYWAKSGAATNGYFTGTGANARLLTQKDGADLGGFHHTIPSPGYRIDTQRRAIAPIDNFGFARSPDYNPAYFNPTVKYVPWKKPDGNNAIVDYPQASTTATLVDPDKTNTIQLGVAGTDATALAWGWAANGTAEEFFVVPNGATLPKDTVIYYRNGNGNSCGGIASNNNWRALTANATLTADCNIAIKYYPATFYLKTATIVQPADTPEDMKVGYTATAKAISNACGSGCTLYKYEIREGNFASKAKFNTALQNFANWFSFYGNRNRSIKAAMTISLADTEKMRVGMFTINSRVNGSYADVTMRDMSVAADKASLYTNQLLKIDATGGTPNRFAVDHIGYQFTLPPADNSEAARNKVPVKYACQINAGMLFTDGYSNTGGPATGSQDADMPAPLADTFSDTLADTAAKYYKMNLRGDLPAGKVPVPDACKTTPDDPKLDCRADPHMNFYGVTLGAKGDIYGQTYDPTTNTPDPYNGWQPPWRSRQDDAPSTVDEIWHATMNSRGKFINASTPADITSAMRSILASVGGGETPSGTIGLTGARIGGNSLSVEPKYTSANSGTDWFSSLTAYKLTGDVITGVITQTQKWEAAGKLEGAGRTIRFGKSISGNVRPQVQDFQATNLGSDDASVQAALCSDALQNCAGKFSRIAGGVTGAEAVSYLRGARNNDGGKLRKRTTLLGDIVNSTPIISSFGDDYGYTGLRSNDGTTADVLNYTNFLSTKRARTGAAREPMVFVGANDGMFHAFDGADGSEKYAYIPATSVGHMGNLLFPYRAQDRNDQVFQHRYFVDGLVTVSDAHDGSAWKTVAVASVGAGGRGVFGLDVTDRDTLNVLWEINDKIGDANGAKDIGSVLGKIAIVPVKDAGNVIKWKAIFGNGYDSVNGKAVLFLVDIADGKVTRITAQETGANLPTRAKNGLGNLVVIDRYQGTSGTVARDGFADTVYAGDLNGAVWKFDLRDNTVAFGGKPLFVARYKDDYTLRQPILGGFEATMAGDNVMIFFGTGSFSFIDDPSDKAMQSIYGILDDGSAPVAGRSELQAQYAYQDPSTTERYITKDRLNATKRGWYLNLGVDSAKDGNPVATGERFVGNPRIQNGTLFFPTYDPVATDGCATTGNNWLYGLNALSGGADLSSGRLASPTGTRLNQNTGAIKPAPGSAGSSTAPNKDIAVVASSRSDILPVNATQQQIQDAIASKCSVMVQTAGAPPIYLPRPCGRQSWRQIR
ncbi:pilus assembly protein [Lysobacter sp. K5869]|uniref:pilus assembly protein n=1 Tax=Lysobacter sp. K5869 TaxID=2820808 RepID=UPI001C05F00F|nr:PilC/PilY family type IV pilus protein [Lysobacter sp. K5869]QWP79058.1 pilus assembly protein [Lysobacter sp. K5869]